LAAVWAETIQPLVIALAVTIVISGRSDMFSPKLREPASIACDAIGLSVSSRYNGSAFSISFPGVGRNAENIPITYFCRSVLSVYFTVTLPIFLMATSRFKLSFKELFKNDLWHLQGGDLA
jgi:hypothetical protein